MLLAADRRYPNFLPAIDDPSNGIDKLNKITRTVHEEARSYRGFNFFDQDDEALLPALARGAFTISGVQNRALRARFPRFSSGRMFRILRRLLAALSSFRRIYDAEISPNQAERCRKNLVNCGRVRGTG